MARDPRLSASSADERLRLTYIGWFPFRHLLSIAFADAFVVAVATCITRWDAKCAAATAEQPAYLVHICVSLVGTCPCHLENEGSCHLARLLTQLQSSTTTGLM